MQDAKLIDHTLLVATARKADIDTLVAEAKEFGFASVCVNPVWVARCAAGLAGTDVKVCTVIGFPLGANTTATKAREAEEAVANGAGEVDMVINIGAALDGNWDAVEADIRAVVKAVPAETVVKVIVETCYLDDPQIVEASMRAVAAGADFVKTSTGFGTAGATEHHVKLMRETVGPQVGVKASGGIRTREDFEKMKAAGANRIGASKGVEIITGGAQ
ncbi:deoxyribose-phosphate aldolase [Corynebacterium epidermidicanis]|uniref:Deoxyribose-phosphate aldolase n=1 Tax=Corynebacterium epidermidicanis TaxID=1050174 RepID=A0A0G3GMK9_9CORY|nr:deoxyribose-phosphate aldolase [Corynebacterium epidermidicanis]AKK02379.1 deoxyribose-phosphate aldolase [Corynebacterium epidermidicanis]